MGSTSSDAGYLGSVFAFAVQTSIASRWEGPDEVVQVPADSQLQVAVFHEKYRHLLSLEK